MLSLFTPATGYPDLEAKIAFGLARVAIEADLNPSIIPYKGLYEIRLDCNGRPPKELNEAFLMLIERLLSSQRFFDLGVKAKDKQKYPANSDTSERLKSCQIDLTKLFCKRDISEFLIKKDIFCGHEDFNKFGGRTGLILLSSFHAGKPYSRDKREDTFNLKLCEVCGYLAVLGLFSFSFNIQMGNKKNRKNIKHVIVLPVPRKELGPDHLLKLFGLQKTLHNYWLSDVQPLRTFTLALLAKNPSISDFINGQEIYFHITLTSKDNRGDTVIEQIDSVNLYPLISFISSSPFNSASILKLLGNSKAQPKIDSLIEIVEVIENTKINSLARFPRLYTLDTSTKEFTNLLFPDTAKYLLKEVAMINQEIIENPAISSLAKTLRYFIREKKYGYADDIRNARPNTHDFEETIAKMLREGELRRLNQEQDKKAGKKVDNWIHLPKESEIKEIFRLANKDFESTKLALVILAFSFPQKGEEQEKD
ncbi:MAG TPA: type I-A CRISPR-associated protein Csa5 [Candidatus Saccharicenans sp.]|nr:type I-A CRISPR-associated protein Csa5 [Candidatus Saccharicenans sp.]HPU92647.1 type I-A CRISPR-associated protein Csa5 [Candidatus Saccharicenans sp.]